MADITKLKLFIDTYGVAVRAGLITPCIEDERTMRMKMGLPAMSKAVQDDWAKTDGIRKPITLAGAAGASLASAEKASSINAKEDNDEDDTEETGGEDGE